MSSQTTSAIEPRSTVARIAYGALAALLLVAVVLETVKHGTGYWQIAVFGLGPDVALFFGAGAGLAKGQLHPRAVGLYNLLHRFWGPVLLAALASFGLIPLGSLIRGLAWPFHLALDRALGHGLRTPDGFQRA
jgi:hypothetical protein